MNNEYIEPAPLDLDLSAVDLAPKLLADGQILTFEILSAEIRPTKAGDGEYIHLKLVTAGPETALSQDGKPLPPGAVTVFDMVMLQPTGRSSWDMVIRRLAQLVKSAQLPPGTARIINGRVNAQEWVPMLVGRKVRARVRYQPEETRDNNETFPARNVISYYIAA